MAFSLGLLGASGLLYLLHFLLGMSTFPYANKVTSFMMGIALVGMILSIACFCMNLGWIQMKKKKTPIWWMVVSVIAFHAFLGYIVLIIIERATAVGIAW